jgi:hypothetical protein
MARQCWSRTGVPSPPPRRRRRVRAVPAPHRGHRCRDLFGRSLVDLAGQPGETLLVGRDGSFASEGHRKQDGLLRAADAPNGSLPDDGFGHAKDIAQEAGRARGGRSVWERTKMLHF